MSASLLRGLPEGQRGAVLDKLAAVRLYAVGAELRWAQRLAATCAPHITSAQLSARRAWSVQAAARSAGCR